MDYNIESWYFYLMAGKSQWYEEQITKIRQETDLYEETENTFYSYAINEQYVSKEDYDRMIERFVEPNESAYQMYIGTYEDPFQY